MATQYHDTKSRKKCCLFTEHVKKSKTQHIVCIKRLYVNKNTLGDNIRLEYINNVYYKNITIKKL